MSKALAAWAMSGQLFLLNAEPGTYVAVAAALQAGNGGRTYAFCPKRRSSPRK
jgi:hypothetical protein